MYDVSHSILTKNTLHFRGDNTDSLPTGTAREEHRGLRRQLSVHASQVGGAAQRQGEGDTHLPRGHGMLGLVVRARGGSHTIWLMCAASKEAL